LQLSVIIPVYNRPSLLSATLESLTHQTLPADKFEVIVCDDGSSEVAALQVLKKFEHQLDLIYVYHPDRGYRVAAARNRGLALARRDVAVFLDADIALDPVCLATIHSRHAANPISSYLGFIHGLSPSIPDELAHTWLTGGQPADFFARPDWPNQYPDRRSELFASFGYDLTRMRAPWAVCWSGLVTAPMDAARRIGGFNETYVGYGPEDLDFGYRLHRAGVTLRADREIRGLHLTKQENSGERIGSLRANLRIFFEQYRTVESELLLCFPHMRMETALANVTALSETALRVEQALEAFLAGEMTGNTIVLVAADATLAQSLAPACIYDLNLKRLPSNQAEFPHVSFVHGLGARTPYADGVFHTCVVTHAWGQLHPFLQEAVLREGARVGRQCFVVEEKESRPSLSEPGHVERLLPHHKVSMVCESATQRLYRVTARSLHRIAKGMNSPC
jgi:glycosyltransferase involved in cell wall biosynthesis